MRAGVIWLAAICIVARVGYARVESSYELELAYGDLTTGPLLYADSREPMRDGSAVQVICDTDGNGITPPESDGSPGAGDMLLRCKSEAAEYTVNGQSRLGSAGYFLIETGMSGCIKGAPHIFVRVWNAESLREATSYADSPLYNIVPGRQQISFSGDEWTVHAWHGRPGDGEADDSSHAANPKAIRLTSYPNPFNAQSTISFQLNEASAIKILVYDLQGRLVRTLADGYMNPGEHQVRFNAENLPSGTYHIALDHGNRYRELTRVILVK